MGSELPSGYKVDHVQQQHAYYGSYYNVVGGHPHSPASGQYQWMYSLIDSSRVSTFLISMLLIVYGSFRSLNMEQEAKEN